MTASTNACRLVCSLSCGVLREGSHAGEGLSILHGLSSSVLRRGPKDDYFQATKHSVPTCDKSDIYNNTNASELRVVTYTCTVLIFWLLWFFIASFWTDDPNLYSLFDYILCSFVFPCKQEEIRLRFESFWLTITNTSTPLIIAHAWNSSAHKTCKYKVFIQYKVTC